MPQWLIALPVIATLIVAVVIASIGAGPLLLGFLFVSVFVGNYLYFYVIGAWRQRRKRGEPMRRELANSQEVGLPVPRWLIALPAIGAAVAVIIMVSDGPGPLTVVVFCVSVVAFGYMYIYMIAAWRARGKNNDTP